MKIMKPTHLVIAGVASVPIFKYGLVKPIAFGGLMGAIAQTGIYILVFWELSIGLGHILF
ncbi:hypothetical protein [Clostridium perfringens]|uniref:hypothetical protein n=1 Tax=Clostridium perfringens TaxID=1502 RepID=UPI0018E4CA43|nr:hypothetical protein [Clostridium perfringens]